MRTIAVWSVLFKYAHEEGQARLRYNDWPTKDNRVLLDEAIERHEEYRQICLEADEMIGLENIHGI